MRVVFLYTSYGPAGAGSTPDWNPKAISENHFVNEHGLPTEGYFYLLKELLNRGIIDDLVIFIESYRSPGHKKIDGVTCYVVPRIEYVENFLKPDDIIFVRGGFRGWYDPFLLRMKKQKRWLLLYAANTGRQRWTIWDIVFTDLSTHHWYDRRGRFWFFFRKPINPNIFKKTYNERDIDVCIGASKIHDKKAQWRVIHALIEHKKMFGKTLKCIMPGHMRYRGTETPNIVPNINKHGLNVEMPGFVNRYELAKILNRSKLFVYLGNSGENDRGPLEATAVGCPVLLGGTTRHAPFLRGGAIGIQVSENPTIESVVAKEMEEMLSYPQHHETVRNMVAKHFDIHNGFEKTIIPDMYRLFNVIRANPIPDINVLIQEFVS